MLSVWITFRSERIHSWPTAPQDILHAHLRSPHRHLFHVRVEARVDQMDREVSFETLRAHSIRAFDAAIPAESYLSCEEMAMRLGQALLDANPPYELFAIDVSEDGESGARWLNEFWVPEEQVMDEPSYG